jgi:glycolate oxidase FAD binding subunit
MKVTFDNLAARFGAAAVGTFALPPARPAWLASLPVVAPDTLEAACEVLQFASCERLHVLPAGAGEHLAGSFPAPLQVPPSPGAPNAAWGGADFVLSTRRLRRVVEYEPEEMVLVAESGVPLHTLIALASPHAQRLPCDVWPGQAATLGGAVAGHRSGLDRLRRGTLRDAILGARVVHADGRSTKTGGKVVKNVTGFDLAKLYIGSRGALVLLGEINLRLQPVAPSAGLVVVHAERPQAEQLLLTLHRSVLLPAAWLLVAGPVCDAMPAPPGAVTLVARFEGNEAAVRWQVAEAVRLTGGVEWPSGEAAAAYDSLRAAIEPRADAVSVRIASLGVDAPRVLACLEQIPAWTAGGTLVAQFGVGLAHARFGTAAVPDDLRTLRKSLAALGARLAVESAPSARWTEVAAAGAGLDAAARDLLARTKQLYDPQGVFPPPVGLGGGS